MDILDDMGVSKLSAKVFFFFKVNYSFKYHLSKFERKFLTWFHTFNTLLTPITLKSLQKQHIKSKLVILNVES